MRFIAGLIVGMMVLAAVAGVVSGADEKDTCAVLFDFGNGRVMWADVPIEEGMNGFNVTVEAADTLGLDLHYDEYEWGPMIDSIGGISNGPTFNDPAWILSIWNSTSGSWESASTGASGVSTSDLEALTWKYDVWGGPAPLATPEHRYPWTSFRYDSMNSGMQEFGQIEHLALNWSKDLGNGAITGSVVGADNLIYVISGGLLNEDWSFASNSSLFCLDMTGEVIWNKDIGKGFQVATPLLYGDMVIAPSADGKLYAFDAADGDELWTFDTGSGSGFGITSSPVAYLTDLIFAAGNGKLFSVNAADGTENWNVAVSSIIYSSSPAIYDGIIYIGDDAGNVSAYAADGALQWSTPVGGKVRASPLVDVDNDRVVVTSSSSNGNITALYLNGTIAWQTEIDVSSASVSLSSEGYVAATGKNIIMIDFNGDKLWNYSLGETFGGGAPTVVGDLIFAVTNEESSRLVAVDLTGKKVNEMILSPAEYAICAPTFIDGLLFVTSNNGYVYAFSTGSEPINPTAPGDDPDEIPWLLVGGIAAIVLIAAVGLVYWNGKRKGE